MFADANSAGWGSQALKSRIHRSSEENLCIIYPAAEARHRQPSYGSFGSRLIMLLAELQVHASTTWPSRTSSPW